MRFAVRYAKAPMEFATIEAPNKSTALKHAKLYRTDALIITMKEKAFSYEDFCTVLQGGFRSVSFDDLSRSDRVKSYEFWMGFKKEDGYISARLLPEHVEDYLKSQKDIQYFNSKGEVDHTDGKKGFITTLPNFPDRVFMKKFNKKNLPLFVIKEIETKALEYHD